MYLNRFRPILDFRFPHPEYALQHLYIVGFYDHLHSFHQGVDYHVGQLHNDLLDHLDL